MKKLLALLLSMLMVFAFCACGATGSQTNEAATDETEATEPAATEPEDGAEIANPVTPGSQGDVSQTTNINLPAPEGAENVSWNTIDAGDGTIAEMNFTYDGVQYCMRATDTVQMDYTKDDVTNISGMNYNWEEECESDVNGRPATVYLCGGQDPAAVIAWMDVVPGIFYTLSTSSESTVQDMTGVAVISFYPMQSEDDVAGE